MFVTKKPAPLLELCRETLKRRTEVTHEMIARLAKRYPIGIPTVRRYAPHSKSLYKQHIMLALMNMGYSMSVLSSLNALAD